MIKITAELKAELTNKKVNENITAFYKKVSEKLKEFHEIVFYSVKNNKLTLNLRINKEYLLDHAEVQKEVEASKNYIFGAVSESKEIYKSEYNEKEITVNREEEEYIMIQFTAELYFRVKEFSNKEVINYLYHEAEKEAKETLEFKLTDKIETDRKKYIFNILNKAIDLPKAGIEKIIKENLRGDQFNYEIEDQEFNINFENFEAETEEFNKKAEEYNKNLIKNYIKETDPELYFAKFSKEAEKETETVKEVKETVKEVKAVKAEEIKEEISEEYYFSLNFHELNKFIKRNGGSDFMKLSAELRFQLWGRRQYLYDITYGQPETR